MCQGRTGATGSPRCSDQPHAPKCCLQRPFRYGWTRNAGFYAPGGGIQARRNFVGKLRDFGHIIPFSGQHPRVRLGAARGTAGQRQYSSAKVRPNDFQKTARTERSTRATCYFAGTRQEYAPLHTYGSQCFESVSHKS